MVNVINGEDEILNVVWYDPEEGSFDAQPIGALMLRSRPMAMLAVNLATIICKHTGLEVDDFVVAVNHTPQSASFAIVPMTEGPERAQALVQGALQAFFADLAIHMEGERGLQALDRDFCTATFDDIRGFAGGLASYYRSEADLYTAEDVKAANGTPDEDDKFYQLREQMLADSWVFSVMPEKPFDSRKAIETHAHFLALATIPYSFAAIDAAIEETEAVQKERAAAQNIVRYPFGMRPN